jgi:hypothetical protein
MLTDIPELLTASIIMAPLKHLPVSKKLQGATSQNATIVNLCIRFSKGREKLDQSRPFPFLSKTCNFYTIPMLVFPNTNSFIEMCKNIIHQHTKMLLAMKKLFYSYHHMNPKICSLKNKVF